jgi:hypothetical protein
MKFIVYSFKIRLYFVDSFIVFKFRDHELLHHFKGTVVLDFFISFFCMGLHYLGPYFDMKPFQFQIHISFCEEK